MEQYIPKSALIAEIEILRNDAHNGVSYHQSRQNVGLNNELSIWEHLENAFLKVLKIIDSFEVREVDLEEEIREYLSTYWPEEKELHPFLGYMAKHFFELGLKVALKGD